MYRKNLKSYRHQTVNNLKDWNNSKDWDDYEEKGDDFLLYIYTLCIA